MNSSWLEQTRFALEGTEALQRAIVKLMFQKLENPKEAVIIDNKISVFVRMIQQKSKEALTLIRDQQPTRKEEMAVISGQKNLNPSDKSKAPGLWQNFYEKSKDLRDQLKKYTPTVQLPTNTVEYFNKVVFSPPEKEPAFSAEEAKGKYVDMHVLYLEYLNVFRSLNLKQEQKFGDYLWFLQNFDRFELVPVPAKMRNLPRLRGYLVKLIEYLHGFLERTRPLINLEIFVNKFREDFEVAYEKGAVSGWEKHEFSIDKSIYCPECQKIFISEDTYVNHLGGKKHIKAAKSYVKLTAQQNEEAERKARQEFQHEHETKMKDLASHEYLVTRYREELANVLYDTMNLIRKKQTRGYEENEQQQQQESESEADPDEPIYNPKNLPLGWDGKPIPYWLYKLHGLGVEYKCEICGNYSYWGRRSFEMHFQEWRHTYGMKCLRIPNTIHFKDVTTINDAIALHQKLLAEAQAAQFRPDMEEEFEDTEGNIINKRTYFDMKKQGIL